MLGFGSITAVLFSDIKLAFKLKLEMDKSIEYISLHFIAHGLNRGLSIEKI
jgi:hypothetical protein